MPSVDGIEGLPATQSRYRVGIVSFRSPRIVSCACEPPWYLETAFCPLWPIIPERATPELLAL